MVGQGYELPGTPWTIYTPFIASTALPYVGVTKYNHVMKTTLGLVDDHQLFMKALSHMLEGLGGYDIVLEARSGKEMQHKIALLQTPPDIILLDVKMPEMSGRDAAQWLQLHYPTTYIVALSMSEEDRTIIEMLKAGCCAYLLKDTHPAELEKALTEIKANGYYHADVGNARMRKLLMQQEESKAKKITTREMEFLHLACSDLTYKQIAHQMKLAERTIDGYRESLFQKMGVQSRVGLCLEAIRQGLVPL